MNHTCCMTLVKHSFVNYATVLCYIGEMAVPEFRRARSAEAKQRREQAILEAAARLGAERGIRRVTLTDIADAVGMHKSAMLRYFETREQIYLKLTAAGWREWSAALRKELRQLGPAVTVAAVARVLADSLAGRPMFCDLLAQAPLNLERNVSIDSVRAFKLVTLDEVSAISAELNRLLGLTGQQCVDVIAAATSLAGALWQMATPGPEVEQLYRSDPRLAHAIVDVGPRLTRVLTALLTGFQADGARDCDQSGALPRGADTGTACIPSPRELGREPRRKASPPGTGHRPPPSASFSLLQPAQGALLQPAQAPRHVCLGACLGGISEPGRGRRQPGRFAVSLGGDAAAASRRPSDSRQIL